MKIILILILLIIVFWIGATYGALAAILATDPKLSLDLTKPTVQEIRDTELYKKLAAKLDKK